MTSPGNGPGRLILNINHILKVMTRVFIISDAFISKTVQRGVVLIILTRHLMLQLLHEHFIIFRPFLLTEKWRSVIGFRLGDPSVFVWHPNYKDFTIKTTGQYNYLSQPIDSPNGSLEALTRLMMIRPRFTPKVTA